MGMSNLKGSTKSGGGRTIKRHHNVKQEFLIDLNQYGGTIPIAKDKIKSMYKKQLLETEVLEKVKVKIKPYNEDFYKVEVSVRTKIKK